MTYHESDEDYLFLGARRDLDNLADGVSRSSPLYWTESSCSARARGDADLSPRATGGPS